MESHSKFVFVASELYFVWNTYWYTKPEERKLMLCAGTGCISTSSYVKHITAGKLPFSILLTSAHSLWHPTEGWVSFWHLHSIWSYRNGIIWSVPKVQSTLNKTNDSNSGNHTHIFGNDLLIKEQIVLVVVYTRIPQIRKHMLLQINICITDILVHLFIKPITEHCQMSSEFCV